MKRKLSPLAVSLCLLGLISIPAHAAVDQKKVTKLAEEVSQLQHEVAELQAQIAAGHASSPHQRRHHAAHARIVASKSTITAAAERQETQPEHDTTVRDVGALPTNGLNYLPVDLAVPGQSFVSSGPYIGVPIQYSGSNLIINTPSVNNDVALLNVRKNINQRLHALGVPEEEDHAHVLLSGIVEGQALYKQLGRGPDSSDIDLSTATLDAYVLGPSNWLSTLISFTYDNSRGVDSGSFASNSRVENARIYLRQAFVTIGDLSKTPVYGTFGQLYVPFGTYNSNMVTPILTQQLARTKQRAIVLGFQPQGDDVMYGSAYIFRGDTHVGSTNRINNGGVNLGVRFVDGAIKGDIGGGMIANIADSIGMQLVANNAANFNGFSGINGTGSEAISHVVPAFDARAVLSLGDHVDLLAEYISATKHFSKTDLTMNNHGAEPQALNAEAAYTFQAFNRPNSVAIGYGMTKDALALELPAQRYSVVFNTSIWRDTLQSLEFRHDVNYGASNVASGSGIPALQASGRADNIVTAQFDVYF